MRILLLYVMLFSSFAMAGDLYDGMTQYEFYRPTGKIFERPTPDFNNCKKISPELKLQELLLDFKDERGNITGQSYMLFCQWENTINPDQKSESDLDHTEGDMWLWDIKGDSKTYGKLITKRLVKNGKLIKTIRVRRKGDMKILNLEEK